MIKLRIPYTTQSTQLTSMLLPNHIHPAAGHLLLNLYRHFCSLIWALMASIWPFCWIHPMLTDAVWTQALLEITRTAAWATSLTLSSDSVLYRHFPNRALECFGALLYTGWWFQIPRETPISPRSGCPCTWFLLPSCFSPFHEVWSAYHFRSIYKHSCFLGPGFRSVISLSSGAQIYWESPSGRAVSLSGSLLCIYTSMALGKDHADYLVAGENIVFLGRQIHEFLPESLLLMASVIKTKCTVGEPSKWVSYKDKKKSFQRLGGHASNQLMPGPTSLENSSPDTHPQPATTEGLPHYVAMLKPLSTELS